MPGLPTCTGEPESSLSDNNILENDADSEDNETNDLLLTDVIITKGREQKIDEQNEENNVDEVELNNNIKPLYHEKQKWELCLLHALNSLLQREEFTHKSLDNICKMLAPNKMINPHKSILNTGNYDANVLMM
eukprot:184231_1